MVHECRVAAPVAAPAAAAAIELRSVATILSENSSYRASLHAQIKNKGANTLGFRLPLRERCRRWLVSLPWQLALIVLIVMDITFVIASETDEYLHENASRAVASVVACVLVADLALRGFVYRGMLCTCSLLALGYTIDAVGVLATLILLAYEIATVKDGALPARSVSYGVRIARGVLLGLRVMPRLRSVKRLQAAARNVTGENKKRLVDLEAGFDLDLALVQPRLIAMSVPAIGTTALYRNPLPEVARFLEQFHGQTGYTIFNACPELPCMRTPFKTADAMCCRCRSYRGPLPFYTEATHTPAASPSIDTPTPRRVCPKRRLPPPLTRAPQTPRPRLRTGVSSGTTSRTTRPPRWLSSCTSSSKLSRRRVWATRSRCTAGAARGARARCAVRGCCTLARAATPPMPSPSSHSSAPSSA